MEGPETGDRQFVTALARGLDVLAAFRRGEGRLGNQELAERTGLPKPTISRITHTLTQLGYLNYNQRLSQYELGGATLSLGYAALSNLDVRRIARPFMQELANATNLTVALALRDKLMMLNIETCEGQALVGLRLSPGSRMPIATTAMGRAYLAVVSEAERTTILNDLRGQFGDEWPSMRRSIERSIKDIEEQGFCVSIGGQKDINGAAAAIPIPDGRGFYALSIGGPAYLASPDYVATEVGPMVAEAARKVIALLGGDMPARPARK
ncbi:IclR family transcriptional regulator [Phreatobacter stygius]|uniref:IclR family transcriptional regulator n=2 Tax=Phreatobacter stygius TaxID=1940610 RepID=A0A4D7B5A6_9HYPH|nr:IclR family transcriptional regulator [Phreatobacter stygius]